MLNGSHGKTSKSLLKDQGLGTSQAGGKRGNKPPRAGVEELHLKRRWGGQVDWAWQEGAAGWQTLCKYSPQVWV